MIKVSLKEILKMDVGILNKYFLVTLIIVLLTVVGYTSYALFSYEEVSSTGIRLKYTGETLPKDNLSTNWKDKTTNELSYVAIYTLDNTNFPETYDYNGTTYTLNKTIDVSEQENGSVLLGEYSNGSIVSEKKCVGLIGQKGGVVAPADSSSLFSFIYVSSSTSYGEIEAIDLSNFDTRNVTDMSNMFAVGGFGLLTTGNLSSLNVSGFDTSQVTDMSYMFEGCQNLTSLDLSNFDTSKVTNMEFMFKAIGVETLDISNFDTSKVTNMTYMFYGAVSKKVIVGCNWKLASSNGAMFEQANCSSVTKVCNE